MLLGSELDWNCFKIMQENENYLNYCGYSNNNSNKFGEENAHLQLVDGIHQDDRGAQTDVIRLSGHIDRELPVPG